MGPSVELAQCVFTLRASAISILQAMDRASRQCAWRPQLGSQTEMARVHSASAYRPGQAGRDRDRASDISLQAHLARSLRSRSMAGQTRERASPQVTVGTSSRDMPRVIGAALYHATSSLLVKSPLPPLRRADLAGSMISVAVTGCAGVLRGKPKRVQLTHRWIQCTANGHDCRRLHIAAPVLAGGQDQPVRCGWRVSHFQFRAGIAKPRAAFRAFVAGIAGARNSSF